MPTKQIYTNVNIITMNPDAPRAEAIGVAGDTICVMGSNAKVANWANGEAEVIDLDGKTMVPGLIDSHSHITSGSLLAAQADCGSVVCRNLEDVQGRIEELARKTEPGQWVQGFGFDDTGIEEMHHLTRDDLDAVSTEHPIFISHISWHLSYLNSRALELCGITNMTPDPDGGHIDKDERGEPTGLLLENADVNARQHLPIPSREQMKEQFVKKIADYNSFGLTSTHDGALGRSESGAKFIGLCNELEQAGKLNIRVYGNVVAEAYPKYAGLGVGRGFGSRYFKIGGVKFFQDGSIQGLTGALLDDYHNKPGWRSELIYPQEQLNEMFCHHQKNGHQIVVHGNGDAAIESILQAFELAQKKYPREDTRHMLIHCQMANPDRHHIERIVALGVIPSYFINHIYYWGDRHKKLFVGPERAARMNPLGSSLQKGMLFSVHSDYPVTPVDPIFSMHTAVNRQTRSGEVLGPEERISPLEALKTFTTHAAICSFEEDVKGSLEVGKLADMTILSDDILGVNPMTMKDIQVLRTIVGGKTVYER
ncbi:amidohydrolase [Chloroflexi bacterium TSY]|nr:amidohydrolase [Chloroflexi bacterium TSY]